MLSAALCCLPLFLLVTPPLLAETSADLLREGDAAAAAGRQLQARDLYDRAVRAGAPLVRDYTRARFLGFAYMHAEPHDFAKAAHWLAAAVALHPSDDETRLAFANALAWGGQYTAAISEYRALAERQAGNRDLQVRIARTLSWARRYSESITAYEALIAAAPADTSLLVEKARVLSWAGCYREAQRVYAQVLGQDSTNFDARVGEAQILYWSGHMAAAHALLQPLVRERPRDEAANLTLASIEHNLGQDNDALRRLRLLPPSRDAKELHDAINSAARPLLDLRFGFGDDREHDASGPSFTYRALRYTASLNFLLTRGVRMEVWNSVVQSAASTPVLAQFGSDALSGETLARLRVRLAPWLELQTGAGEGRTGISDLAGGPGGLRHSFLYEIHPTITRGGLRFDLSLTRRLAASTPLATYNGLVLQRFDAEGSYTWHKRLRAGAEFWHGDYSLRTPADVPFAAAANGGALYLLPVLIQHERLTFEAGLRYELFGFDHGAERIEQALGSSGVFMPRVYQRYSGTASATWSPRAWVSLGLRGSFGPQRVFGFASLNPAPARFDNTGTAGAEMTFRWGKWSPYAAADYFATATPGAPGLRDGQYGSTQLILGVRRRF